VRDELDGMESTANNANSLLMMSREDKRLLIAELELKDNAITKLESELASGEVKQLTLFPGQDTTPEQTPEPTPEPNPVKLVIDSDSEIVKPESTPEPKSKSKAKSKAKPVQEIDTNSLIVPPGYQAVGSAELIEFVLKKFPDSKLKTKGQLTDAIRDKDTKAKGSEFSRLFGWERDYSFKHLGKVEENHKFLIPNL
jgi:hypothetical protein